MGGRMKHVIVSINPLGRLLYTWCARADARTRVRSHNGDQKVVVHQSYVVPSSYGDREKNMRKESMLERRASVGNQNSIETIKHYQ